MRARHACSFREEEPPFLGERRATPRPQAYEAMIDVIASDASGSAVAGRVRAVGDELPLSWIGRRVAARCASIDAAAELVPVAAATMIALPQGLSDREAVALLVEGVAAYARLEELALPVEGILAQLDETEVLATSPATVLLVADEAGVEALWLQLAPDAPGPREKFVARTISIALWQRLAARAFEDALAGRIRVTLPATSALP